MDSLTQLKLAIIESIKSRIPVQTVWAECVSTNIEDGTMVAKADELEYDDVLLGLGPDITVPEVGAKVLIGLVGNQREATYLLFTDRISLRRINGDVFGGLVKVEELVTELNSLKQDLNTLKSAVSAWIPVPNDGGAALKASVTAWSGQVLEPAVSAQLQNPIVTHG